MSTYGPYSQVRQAGKLYFISGQVGINPETKQAGVDIHMQTRQTLDNLQTCLNEHGLIMDQVIKTTIYLTDMDDFATMNDVYVAYFKEPRPARACVEVAALPKLADNKLVVEIEAVVYKP